MNKTEKIFRIGLTGVILLLFLLLFQLIISLGNKSSVSNSSIIKGSGCVETEALPRRIYTDAFGEYNFRKMNQNEKSLLLSFYQKFGLDKNYKYPNQNFLDKNKDKMLGKYNDLKIDLENKGISISLLNNVNDKKWLFEKNDNTYNCELLISNNLLGGVKSCIIEKPLWGTKDDKVFKSIINDSISLVLKKDLK